MTDSDNHGGPLVAHAADKVWAENLCHCFGSQLVGRYQGMDG